jgi:hypothetical protein
MTKRPAPSEAGEVASPVQNAATTKIAAVALITGPRPNASAALPLIAAPMNPPSSTPLTIMPSLSGPSCQSSLICTMAPATMPVSKPNSKPPMETMLAITSTRI